MNEKTKLLTQFRDEFNRWEALLGQFSEADITARQLPSDLSIKDVMAHLWAWQQRSIARMEAGLHHRDPVFPDWPKGLDPETDEEPYGINAWIHETNKDKSWEQIHREWREGYLRLLELGEVISEEDLMQPGRFTWLEGEPLALVLTGSYEHHRVDHYEPLLTWLVEHGKIEKPATGI